MQSELDARARALVAAYVEARVAHQRAIDVWNRENQAANARVAAEAAGQGQGGGALAALGGLVRRHLEAVINRPVSPPTAAIEAANHARADIIEAEPALRIACVLVLIERILDRKGDVRGYTHAELWMARGGAEAELLWILLRDPLPFSTENLTRLLNLLAGHEQTWKSSSYMSVDYLLRHVVQHVQQFGKDPALMEALERLLVSAKSLHTHYGVAPALATIDDLFGIPIDPRDAWGKAVRPWFLSLPEDEQAAWLAFFLHVRSGSGSRPSTGWLNQAREKLAALGGEAARERLLTLIGHLHDFARSTDVLADRNGSLIRGLFWCMALYEGRDVAQAVADACIECFKKLPGTGPRAVKQGNAAIWVLGNSQGMDGVIQLQRLGQRIKDRSALKLIDSSLAAAAKRAGLTREDLEELVVPDFGLVDGKVSFTFPIAAQRAEG